MDMEKDSSSTLGPIHQKYKDFIKRFKDDLRLEYAEPSNASSKGPTRTDFLKRPYLLRIPVATNNEYGFEISLHVPRYKPEDITVRTRADNCIIIEGKREEMTEGDVFETMKFTRRYRIPDGIDPETLTCTFIDGLLHITAPRKFKITDRTLPITVLE